MSFQASRPLIGSGQEVLRGDLGRNLLPRETADRRLNSLAKPSSSLGVTKAMSLAAPGANSSQPRLNASVASPAVGNFSVSRPRSAPCRARFRARLLKGRVVADQHHRVHGRVHFVQALEQPAGGGCVEALFDPYFDLALGGRR